MPIKDHNQWFRSRPNEIWVQVYAQNEETVEQLIEWTRRNQIKFLIQGSNYVSTAFAICYILPEAFIKQCNSH